MRFVRFAPGEPYESMRGSSESVPDWPESASQVVYGQHCSATDAVRGPSRRRVSAIPPQKAPRDRSFGWCRRTRAAGCALEQGGLEIRGQFRVLYCWKQHRCQGAMGARQHGRNPTAPPKELTPPAGRRPRWLLARRELHPDRREQKPGSRLAVGVWLHTLLLPRGEWR